MSEEISGRLEVKRAEIVKKGRNISKADIYACEINGKRAILKDYGTKNFAIRFLVGRWFSKREFMIYQSLKGLPGIPQCLIRPDQYSFALEYIDGCPLPETRSELITPATFQCLRTTIERIHARGIACGDIHQRDIIITSNAEVYLVDFATGWKRGGRFNFARNLIFRFLYGLDLLSFYRIRQKYTGVPPSEDEKKQFSSIIWLYHSGRLVKRIFDTLRGRNS